MKRNWKMRWLPAMLGLMLALGGGVCASAEEAEGAMEAGVPWSVPTATGSEIPVVSHGLTVLSAGTDVAFSTMVGNDVVFDATGFARGLNLSSVRYITVMSVPSVTDGELLLGSSKIVAGQTVTAQQLPNMTFHPATESPLRTSFTFTANGVGTPMLCALYLLDEVNYTPTVSMASGLSLEVQTYRGVSAYGTLSAYDPDGDDLIFEVVSYPQNGTLHLTDPVGGAYVYKPFESYVGSDSFTYVARDRYGNYSASATVSLTVDYSGTSVTYADMQDSQAYGAALKMTEEGIMSGTVVGDQYYFYPEDGVSRVEFLVMAMHALGIRDVPACTATVFADDSEIADGMKGYVAMANSLGVISGVEENGKLYFRPGEILTRAQAAVMLEALIEPDEGHTLSVFADHSTIPVWAADAMYALNAAGILTSDPSGTISPETAVNRAQAAQVLKAAMEYVEMQKAE